MANVFYSYVTLINGNYPAEGSAGPVAQTGDVILTAVLFANTPGGLNGLYDVQDLIVNPIANTDTTPSQIQWTSDATGHSFIGANNYILFSATGAR